MSRYSTSYDFDLKVLTVDDFIITESKAKALGIDEVLDYLCLTKAEIPEAEYYLLLKAHRRGRMAAISMAADKLFVAMSNKNGHQASIEYLKQFSSTFSIETTPTSSSSGFNFNVVLKDSDGNINDIDNNGNSLA